MTVEKKRTNRTRQERLTDDIVERANNAQLIELLNSKAFRTSREKIQAKLANEQGIDFESFKIQFQEWINRLWIEKDDILDELKSLN